MNYANFHTAIFLERLNRFVARVMLDGEEVSVHVKNTGRCRELLVPGCTVYLEKSDNTARKYAYDLIAVEKVCPDGTKLINMDSMAPNKAAAEWLENGGLGKFENLRAEVKEGDSRFDFSAEQEGRRVFIEVKGCTLEADGIASFPDAPTERGVKHVRGLAGLAREGNRCIVLIVIQMKGIHVFRPNWDTHPEFGYALCEAAQAGVEIIAVDCVVRPGYVSIDAPVPVDLDIPEHRRTN
ncbi:MAG: DNA/RNA nuclease SfsA [Clostridia bacterium]|nr:DNA/RNA nuclease SfsA [Clostridia bacterium]